MKLSNGREWSCGSPKRARAQLRNSAKGTPKAFPTHSWSRFPLDVLIGQFLCFPQDISLDTVHLTRSEATEATSWCEAFYRSTQLQPGRCTVNIGYRFEIHIESACRRLWALQSWCSANAWIQSREHNKETANKPTVNNQGLPFPQVSPKKIVQCRQDHSQKRLHNSSKRFCSCCRVCSSKSISSACL